MSPARDRKVYTRTGDDGTTGLFHGGRVAKDASGPMAYGAVDEAVSALGVARAQTGTGSELDELLIRLQRELFVAGAHLSGMPLNHQLTERGALIPLSDLLGVSRQATVLAYQIGAGLCELITPSNGALMAILLAAGVPYQVRDGAFERVAVTLVDAEGFGAVDDAVVADHRAQSRREAGRKHRAGL